MAKRWYSIDVFSNYEKRVAEQIRAAVEKNAMSEDVSHVLVPTEDVIEIRRGRKYTRERRYMPGYVLIRMEMSDRGYNIINSINRVRGFLGPAGNPTPMHDYEVDAIIERAERGSEQPRALITFDTGERVSVIDGPFEGFSGSVESVDEENSRLTVSVSIFGRATPVEFEYTQVTKHS